jgi:predicted dehydrogenase
MLITRVTGFLLLVSIAAPAALGEDLTKVIRVGLIGTDTSHATEFTKIINAGENPEIKALKVVAAYPGGSEDLPESRDRVKGYAETLQKGGVEIVNSIPDLLGKVDVVMLESIDGRKHLEQAKPVFESGKLMFIDKPLAGSLAEGMAIAELAKKHNAKWFSSSALRYTPGIANARNNPKVGDVTGCDAWSPCATDPTVPDLYWYGIHGVETLFTVMGPGCVSVSRASNEGTDFVTGVWSDGRVGTLRGIRKGARSFGATVFGTKGVAQTGDFAGYPPLIVEVAKFFKTGVAPVAPEQTLEILAFMDAADESKKQGGAVVTIQSVMDKARAKSAELVK